jgi:hypothetical protein
VQYAPSAIPNCCLLQLVTFRVLYMFIAMASPFFRLPRELRDEVYKYALYHADGLLFKVAECGVGRLEKKFDHQGSKRSFIRQRLRPPAMALAMRASNKPGYNQLRYVCKLLRDETAGMAVRYNLIHVQDTATMNAIEQCVHLFRYCKGLRQVAVRCNASSFAKEIGNEKLAAILRHCVMHADVLVRFHVPYWTQADPEFVRRGLSYLWRLRGDVCLIKRLAYATSVTYLCSSESEMLMTNIHMPSNFRLCPWEDEFSAQLFARACRARPMLVLPPVQAAIGNIEHLTRTWIVSGL